MLLLRRRCSMSPSADRRVNEQQQRTRNLTIMRRSPRKRSKALSATELAQMGICERLVFFEHQYGKRCTALQYAAMRRGLKEHARFHLRPLAFAERKARRYVTVLKRILLSILKSIAWCVTRMRR